MSRALSLGNGNILVCIDDSGQLRDFYFHYVGLENQMYQGCMGRLGVFVDGSLSWLSDDGWNIVIDYKYETLVGNIVAVNPGLGVELIITDAVYNEKNIFIRQVVCKNTLERAREIKLFFGQEFHFYETQTGDTGYFDPTDNIIVHYKGRRVIVVGGKIGEASFSDYSVGVFGIEGKEGSYLDAADGQLAKNAVEHGPVDSIIGFESMVEAHADFSVSVWLTIGKSLDEAKALHAEVLFKLPDHIIKTTGDYWKAWVNKSDIKFGNLERRLVDLYKKSLLIARTHIDNTGAIIASGDSDMLQFGKDTYSYVWMRDASLVSLALDNAGFTEVTKCFFDFCREVISEDGYFYHKYRSDKSIGSSWHPWSIDGQSTLPIQEDETALVIYSLWNHYQLTKDLEFIESLYNPVIKKAANFMVGFRDLTTKLPSASYDLWEMKYGISTFTSAAVFAALKAASEFAQLLGKEKESADYKKVATEIRQAALKYLWNDKQNFFYKQIEVKQDQILHDETVDISSFYAIWKFGLLDIDDEKLTLAGKVVEEKLWCNTKIGGYARFVGDSYYREKGITDTPGNAWFITSLWMAQYEIAKAKSKTELARAHDVLLWVVNNALPSGILSEQIDPYTGSQLSASPLIWGHAEFIQTVLDYIKK